MRSDAEAFSMDKVLRQAVVVPESKRVDRMLKEFRSQRYHMAIVIDEFGGVSGLVTIEDILELIVGEVEGECGKRRWYRLPSAESSYLDRARTGFH